MAKVYEFLANGFEEVEALAPVDILRRGGVEVKTVSITGSPLVESSHGVMVKADLQIEDLGVIDDADMLLIPGGMPGAANLNLHEGLRKLLVEHAHHAAEESNGDEDSGEHEGDGDRTRQLLVGKLLFLLARHLRRPRKRADADDEGLYERDRAAQERLLKDGEAVGEGAHLLRLDGDPAVGRAHCRRRTSGSTHHHALDDRLPADHEFFVQRISSSYPVSPAKQQRIACEKLFCIT